MLQLRFSLKVFVASPRRLLHFSGLRRQSRNSVFCKATCENVQTVNR
jgi:hypothetical protein